MKKVFRQFIIYAFIIGLLFICTRIVFANHIPSELQSVLSNYIEKMSYILHDQASKKDLFIVAGQHITIKGNVAWAMYDFIFQGDDIIVIKLRKLIILDPFDKVPKVVYIDGSI